MADRTSTVFLVMVIAGFFFESAVSKQTWTVADSDGWNLNSTFTFDQWAAGKNFQVGDDLLFSYTAGQHNVLEVTQSNLASCNPTDPIATYTTDPAIVALTTPGYHGFISGYPGDCANGMHMSLQVSGGSPSPTSTPAAAPTPSISSPPIGGPPVGSPPIGSPGSPRSSEPPLSNTPPASAPRSFAGGPGSSPVGSPSIAPGFSPVPGSPSIAPVFSPAAGPPGSAPTGNPVSAPGPSSPATGPPGSAPTGNPVSAPGPSSPATGSPNSSPIGSPVNTFTPEFAPESGRSPEPSLAISPSEALTPGSSIAPSTSAKAPAAGKAASGLLQSATALTTSLLVSCAAILYFL